MVRHSHKCGGQPRVVLRSQYCQQEPLPPSFQMSPQHTMFQQTRTRTQTVTCLWMKSAVSPSHPQRARRMYACGVASSASSSERHTANASSLTLPTPLPKASPRALAGKRMISAPWGSGHVL